MLVDSQKPGQLVKAPQFSSSTLPKVIEYIMYDLTVVQLTTLPQVVDSSTIDDCFTCDPTLIPLSEYAVFKKELFPRPLTITIRSPTGSTSNRCIILIRAICGFHSRELGGVYSCFFTHPLPRRVACTDDWTQITGIFHRAVSQSPQLEIQNFVNNGS